MAVVLVDSKDASSADHSAGCWVVYWVVVKAESMVALLVVEMALH